MHSLNENSSPSEDVVFAARELHAQISEKASVVFRLEGVLQVCASVHSTRLRTVLTRSKAPPQPAMPATMCLSSSNCAWMVRLAGR